MIENIELQSTEGALWFSDEAEITIDEINFEFEQKSKLRGKYRKLTIFNGDYCFQAIKNRHKRKYKYRVALAYLDPRPVRERHIAWKWLYVSLALWALDIVLVFTGWLETSSANFLGLFIGITVAALMTLLAFFYNSRDKVFFRTQYGKIKLVEIINKNPDADSFRSFITKFVMQINKCKTAKGYNQNKFLARELQELRRLKDEAVIPAGSYEKAKRLIFKHEAFSAAE